MAAAINSAMRPRQPLPRLWLMTDERQGDALFGAIARLPEGAGIVFRHHSLAEVARHDLFDRVRAAAPGPVLLAGPADRARAWGADGSHGRGRGAGLRSASVHSLPEIRIAERHGAALLFLAPVYPTRSHPEARPLGLARFAWLARRTTLPVIALGGMNEARGARLASFGAYGWGGIDAWTSGG
jgi:thiamine-phosphate pyrophosphorylase